MVSQKLDKRKKILVIEIFIDFFEIRVDIISALFKS